jgi:hypothetical protein
MKALSRLCEGSMKALYRALNSAGIRALLLHICEDPMKAL